MNDLEKKESNQNLGMVYLTDETKNFDWLVTVAEQGNADAQFWLGDMYLRGEGCNQDTALSVMWWEKSAENGDGRAAYSLAELYETDVEYCEQNLYKALRWYIKAEELGTGSVPRRLETLKNKLESEK